MINNTIFRLDCFKKLNHDISKSKNYIKVLFLKYVKFYKYLFYHPISNSSTSWKKHVISPIIHDFIMIWSHFENFILPSCHACLCLHKAFLRLFSDLFHSLPGPQSTIIHTSTMETSLTTVKCSCSNDPEAYLLSRWSI